jgi:hypothetical protein
MKIPMELLARGAAIGLSITDAADKANQYVTGNSTGAVVFYNAASTEMHLSFDYTKKVDGLSPDYTVSSKKAAMLKIPQELIEEGQAFFVGPDANDASVGSKRDSNTKVEFTMKGYAGKTFFDVDVEKGFTVPVMMSDLGGTAESGCSVDKLADCPDNLKEGDSICKNDQSSSAIKYYREDCPHWYVQSDDKQTTVPISKKMIIWVVAGPDAGDELKKIRSEGKSKTGSK